MGQKSRASKTSQGIHGGGGKTTLTHLQKILMGKGAYQSMKTIGGGDRRPSKKPTSD